MALFTFILRTFFLAWVYSKIKLLTYCISKIKMIFTTVRKIKWISSDQTTRMREIDTLKKLSGMFN